MKRRSRFLSRVWRIAGALMIALAASPVAAQVPAPSDGSDWRGVPVLPQPKEVAVRMDGGEAPTYRTIEVQRNGFSEKMTAAVEEELAALADPKAEGAFTVDCRLVAKPAAIRQYMAGRGQAMSILPGYADKIGDEGYLLSLEHPGATIVARTERGIYHGLQSLKQLLRARYGGEVEIADWPDVKNRVFFDDISRGPLPNIPQVKRQIEQLAELKYSGFTFYIEHVVQPASRPDFAPVNGRYTMADVREICAWAARYNMEVIGSFQSFGHFEHILALPQYAAMGETASLISPLDPNAQAFLKDVIGELCDNFSSQYFNINCDETWDLDKGRSREYVARVGADKFYADHIKFLYDVVKSKGKQTMVWGDIIMKYPHLIKQLPKDLIYLPWTYDAKESFDPWIKPFANAGARFWVCPGIVASNRLTPEMGVVRGNMEFIRQGHTEGAGGVILTSWDDPGLHNFSQLYYGVALGAETMWNTGEPDPKDDFDARFECVRFGRPDAGFVATLDQLLELSKVSATYQMLGKVFDDRFVPEPGSEISINLKQWREVERIVAQTEALFKKIKGGRGPHDLETLGYTIAQYRFLASARLTVAGVSGAYERALRGCAADPEKSRRMLLMALDATSSLAAQVQRLESQYTRLWLQENMSYTLDYGLERYAEKRAQVEQVRGALIAAVDAIDRGGKPAPLLDAGLAVRDVDSDYFGAWLLTGIFPNGDLDVDYLAPVGGERNENPIPGQRYVIDGRDYIWTRVLSPNGFTMDFHDRYESDNNALAYATAEIISGKAQEVTALFGCSGEAEVICNGVVVLRTGKEQSFTADKYPVKLPLREGNNRIIVKSKQLVNEWKFSLRLDGRETQANKQRYRIE